jgi:hypothetical protein
MLSSSSPTSDADTNEVGEVDVMRQPIVEEPYVKRSGVLKGYLEGVKCMEVPNKLSVKEAGSVFETWMMRKALASREFLLLFPLTVAFLS